jgi:capsular polysaccharide biosynthesis protein
MIALVALLVGMVGGIISANLVASAYAASNAILVSDFNEVLTKCDFSKTIILIYSKGFACVPK